MAKNETTAWAIFARRSLHLDKITPTADESWGLLVDEVARLPAAGNPSIDALRTRGYSCQRVIISWTDILDDDGYRPRDRRPRPRPR